MSSSLRQKAGQDLARLCMVATTSNSLLGSTAGHIAVLRIAAAGAAGISVNVF